MLLNQGIKEFSRYMVLIDRSKETITGYEKRNDIYHLLSVSKEIEKL